MKRRIKTDTADLNCKQCQLLNNLEETMEKRRMTTLPRWMFMILALGGAWASGIYLGKITEVGFTIGSLIPALAFGLMSLLMAWGTIAKR
jgi:hypothetical protein